MATGTAQMMAARLLRRLGAALVVGVLLGAVLAVPTTAYACSCAEAPSDRRSSERAAVVLTGDLLDDDANLFGGTRTLTYRVHRVFKGSAFAEQRLVTQASSASCGLEVGGPGRYLVFAQRRNASTLTGGLCQGTRVGTAPASFGPGVAPRPGSGAPAGRWWQVSAASITVLAIAIALARRRSKAKRGPA